MRFAVHFNFAIELDGSSLLSRSSFSRLRRLVKERDNAICYYCGKKARRGQADHIHPLSKGGTDDLSNLVWACSDCNQSKKNQTGLDWLFAADTKDSSARLDFVPDLKTFLAEIEEGEPCTTRTAQRAGVSRDQFIELRDRLIEQSLAEWKYPGAKKQGIELTDAGVRWARQVLEEDIEGK